MTRLKAIVVAALLVLLGVSNIGGSFVAAAFFFIAGMGFASPLFLFLSALCAGLFVFSIYLNVKVLLPFGRLLLKDK